MGERIDIGGHPTWVESLGDGATTVLLLHGGGSNSDTLLDGLAPPLLAHHRVVAFDRRGHGYTADTAAPFHYDDMATETIGVIETVVGGPAHLVGWSDGGITALLVAIRRPDLIDRLALIGTNFHVDGIIGRFDVPADSRAWNVMSAAYAARSPDGAGHFATVMDKFITLANSEPTLTAADLAAVTCPTLVMAGDDDIVRFEHTVALYEAVAQGQLSIVPGTSHGLPLERPDEVARIVLHFLAADVPPATMMPERRVRPAPPG